MNNNMNIIESRCFYEAQATPTIEKNIKKSYEDYQASTKELVINYIKSNSELHYNNLIIPSHTNFEVREIAKLKEMVAKTRVLPYYDNLLINSTPLSQAINFMLGSRDTVDNYKLINKLLNNFANIGVFMIDLSKYAIVLNPQHDFIKQREILFRISNVVEVLDKKELSPKFMDKEVYGLYHKVPTTILFSVENLGYDVTEEDYNNLLLVKEKLNNELIVKAAKELGFEVKFLFKKALAKIETDNNLVNDTINDIDDLFI